MSARPGARSSAASTSEGTPSVPVTDERSGARGAYLLEERLDASRVLQRMIGTEIEVWRDPQIEVLAQPIAYEAAGTLERRHRRLPLSIVAEHRDEDLGRPQVLGGIDLGDRHEAEPRILQLALQQDRDLF